MKNRDAKVFAIANLVAYIFMVVMNVLANALPINGLTTKEVSDSYPNLFAPAGITFSIWGLIYVLFACFIVYSLVGVFNGNDKTIIKLKQIGPWFFLSSIANGLWIIAWHHKSIYATVCLILVMLFSILFVYRQIRKLPMPYGAKEYFFLQLPFGVYLGWLSIATIANITALLVAVHWGRFGLSEDSWLSVMLSIAVLLTVFLVYKKKDLEYALVIIWAFIGIIIKRNQAGDTGLIGYYTAIVGIFILVLSLYIFLRPRNTI